MSSANSHPILFLLRRHPRGLHPCILDLGIVFCCVSIHVKLLYSSEVLHLARDVYDLLKVHFALYPIPYTKSKLTGSPDFPTLLPSLCRSHPGYGQSLCPQIQCIIRVIKLTFKNIKKFTSFSQSRSRIGLFKVC